MNTKKKTLHTILEEYQLEENWRNLTDEEVIAEIQALVAEAIPDIEYMDEEVRDTVVVIIDKVTTALVERGLLKKEKIMDKYDLVRYCANIASPIFRMMGWTWGEKTPPNYNEIVETIEELINEAKVGGAMGTGRLHVEKFRNEKGEIEAKVFLELGQTVLFEQEKDID